MHPLMGRSRSPSPSRRTPTALVVIDVQVGVVATCADVQGVISRISSLVSRARDAVAPVIWVQHADDYYLVRDSKEWELAPGLPEPLADEVRVYKRFRDSFTAPELEEELHARGVRHLVLVGAQSDYCVRTTAQSAAVRGYAVTVPRDAHTTEDAEYGGTKISAQQIVQHTNAYFDDFEYQPGVRCRNVAAHEVDFGRRA